MTHKRPKSKKKFPKLSARGRKLASKYIAEERRAGRPQKTAVPIGISRARAAEQKREIDLIVNKYL